MVVVYLLLLSCGERKFFGSLISLGEELDGWMNG
jgi:hypothetical protein